MNYCCILPTSKQYKTIIEDLTLWNILFQMSYNLLLCKRKTEGDKAFYH